MSVVIQIGLKLLSHAGKGVHPDHIFLHADGQLDVVSATPGPGYRAPENRGAAPQPIEDVYLIGTILYELLSGRRLGQLPEREILHGSALDRVLGEIPALPDALKIILKAMLAFRPEARAGVKLAQQELSQLEPSVPDYETWVRQYSVFQSVKTDAKTSVPPIHATDPSPIRRSTTSWIALAGMGGCVVMAGIAFLVGLGTAIWLGSFR